MRPHEHIFKQVTEFWDGVKFNGVDSCKDHALLKHTQTGQVTMVTRDTFALQVIDQSSLKLIIRTTLDTYLM